MAPLRALVRNTVDEVQADPVVREVYLGRSRDERSGASLLPVPVLEAAAFRSED